MPDPRFPTSLDVGQKDFVRQVRSEFDEITEAYIVCVLAGYIWNMNGLDVEVEKRIRFLARNRTITLPAPSRPLD